MSATTMSAKRDSWNRRLHRRHPGKPHRLHPWPIYRRRTSPCSDTRQPRRTSVLGVLAVLDGKCSRPSSVWLLSSLLRAPEMKGIEPLICQYGSSAGINAKVVEAEMILFKTGQETISLQILRRNLTFQCYPQYYWLVQMALTLPVCAEKGAWSEYKVYI